MKNRHSINKYPEVPASQRQSVAAGILTQQEGPLAAVSALLPLHQDLGRTQYFRTGRSAARVLGPAFGDEPPDGLWAAGVHGWSQPLDRYLHYDLQYPPMSAICWLGTSSHMYILTSTLVLSTFQGYPNMTHSHLQQNQVLTGR